MHCYYKSPVPKVKRKIKSYCEIIKNVVYAYLQCSSNAFLNTVLYFMLLTSGGSEFNALAARK